MPYRYVENEIMVSYLGITIYHLYRNNYEDAGWRDYWFTLKENGCEDDEDAFDIRDMDGYDSGKTIAANLVAMIEEGQFGAAPEDYDRYIDEENSRAGICPVCATDDLDYGVFEVQDESISYPFTCKNCGVSGNEYASLSFNGFGLD